MLLPPNEPNPTELDAFWSAARSALPDTILPAGYQVRWIGLDEGTTTHVIELIACGDKTGTFTLPWVVEHTDQPAPAIGDAIILIDFAGRPRLLVRLTEIDSVNFRDITEAHTSVDGTPVRDLAVWKPLHTKYWNEWLAPHGLEVRADMPVWVERFELLYENPD